jgi:hypothetical protein
LGKGLAEMSTFFYARVLPVQIQCTDEKSLPGYPGNVPPGKHSSVCYPGNVLPAATAALISEKK